MLNMSRVLGSVEKYEARLSELTTRMSAPEVLADHSALREIGREVRRLESLIQSINAYRSLETQLAEARELADGDDAEMAELAAAEIPELEARRPELEKTLQLLLIPADPNDDKNVILEIRAGTGGEEAALFAGDLLRMYTRHAERRGWRTELIALSESGAGGVKEALMRVSGEEVHSRLKFESGVHRVQRVPETEASGRIHTSAASVVVLPEAEDVDVSISPDDIRVDVFRASGAGGQHVNKTESAVRLTHVPTGLVVSCQDEKSQHKNRARAMVVLRSRLYDLEQRKKQEAEAAMRRSQVSSGDRSAKIRTYNFPQGRVTDHRIKMTLHRLPEFLDGDLDEMSDALMLVDAQERLEAASLAE